MRIEKSYLEPISCLQWAYRLAGKMMREHETIKENERTRWKLNERRWAEEERGEGWGSVGEIKGLSRGERLQGEINWTVAGLWWTWGCWKVGELYGHELILDLLLNYPGNLTSSTRESLWWTLGGLLLWQPINYILGGSWTKDPFIHVYWACNIC